MASSPHIVVIDYHKGNLSSVVRGLARAGADAASSDDPAAIRGADGLVASDVHPECRKTSLSHCRIALAYAPADAVYMVAADRKSLRDRLSDSTPGTRDQSRPAISKSVHATILH